MTVATTPRLAMPAVGQLLPVVLPSEITRAEVVEVKNSDHIVAKLVVTPMGKSHSYKLGDKVKCHRVAGTLGERWEVV